MSSYNAQYSPVALLAMVLWTTLISACEHSASETHLARSTPTMSGRVPAAVHCESPSDSHRTEVDVEDDTWMLWTTGTQLRGSNIYQRRVYPELDGPEFMGTGAIGPPYIQADFDALASLGANYVNISHPGLFSEAPPYNLDPQIQDNLDALLRMIEKADMFAVISFRTGPGRSEFTFMGDGAGDWFDESYLNDSV